MASIPPPEATMAPSSPHQSVHRIMGAAVSPGGSCDGSAAAAAHNNDYKCGKQNYNDVTTLAIVSPDATDDTLRASLLLPSTSPQSTTPTSSLCSDIRSLCAVTPSSIHSTIDNNHHNNNHLDSATNINIANSSSSNIGTPLKSPFASSISLLDSKLLSLRKRDEALGDKIDHVAARMEREDDDSCCCGGGSVCGCYGGGCYHLDNYGRWNDYLCHRWNEMDKCKETISMAVNALNDSPRSCEIIHDCAAGASCGTEDTNERPSTNMPIIVPSSEETRPESTTTLTYASCDINMLRLVENDASLRRPRDCSNGISDQNVINGSCLSASPEENDAGSVSNDESKKHHFHESGIVVSSVSEESEEHFHKSGIVVSSNDSETFKIPATNSLGNIGKVSHGASAANNISSDSNGVTDENLRGVDENNHNRTTLFFSPVEASESQIYFTPFGTAARNNWSLGARRDGNLFNNASNLYADCEQSGDRGMIMTTDRGSEAGKIGPQEVNDVVECERRKNNLQTTSGQSCNRASAPSLCSTEASISQVLWSDQNDSKSEASGNTWLPSSERQYQQGGNRESPSGSRYIHASSPPSAQEATVKQFSSSPIQPKQLYNAQDSIANDNSTEDKRCDSSEVPVSARHVSMSDAKGNIHRADAFDESDQSSSSKDPVSTAARGAGDKIITTASLTHQYYAELDRMERDDLLALAVKLQCWLLDRNFNSMVDTADTLDRKGGSIPASKPESKISMGNIGIPVLKSEKLTNECHENEKTKAMSPSNNCTDSLLSELNEFRLDEDELEHEIDPEVVANASLNVSQKLSVCNSCVELKRYKEQIASLTLENEQLKSQLESFDRNDFTPNKNNCTNVISSPQTSPNNDCARPVDLETLFRATPRKNEIDSSSLSRYSSTDNCESSCRQSTQVSVSVLGERLKEATESREHLEELHRHFIQKHRDFECDLIEIKKDRDSVVYELDQVSSLVLLLEDSQESLMSSKLITEKECDQLNSQAECLTKQLSEVRSEVKSHEVNPDNFNNQTPELLRDRIDCLEADKSRILEKFKQTELRLIDAKSEIDLVTKEREKQDKRINQLLSDLTAIDEEKAQLEESVAKLSIRVDDIRQQIHQNEATIETLRRYSGRLEDTEMQLRLAMAFDDDETTTDFQILDHNQFDERSCLLPECTADQVDDTAAQAPPTHVAGQNEVDTTKDAMKYLSNTSQAKSHEIQSDQDHFRSLSANLSVMVLQHKFRSRRTSEHISINECELLFAKEKLAVAENSLEKLNADYCRLEQGNLILRKEYDSLSMELNGLSISRSSSEALVLENDCEVEAVNCTRYSPMKINEAKLDLPLCNKNIQPATQLELESPLHIQNLNSRIGGLVLALIKLKIRERSLSKNNKELRDREIQFQDKIAKTEEVITQLLSHKHHLQVQIVESNETTAILEKQVVQAQNSALLRESASKEDNQVKECDQSVEISLENLKQYPDLENQINSLHSQLALAQETHSRTITELKASHEREKQLDFHLTQEKEAASLLRHQLEDVISQKAELETSMKDIVDENQRQLISIESLKTERDSMRSKLLTCQDAITISSQRIRALESELKSQEDSNANIFQQTVAELNRKIDSLTSERDHTMQQFVSANEVNTVRIENEKLQHRLYHSGNQSDMMDWSVKSFDSCEHVGTICEEERPTSPGTEIFQILSSPTLTDEDILKVSNKMRQVHSTLNKVQQERSSLRQKVKLLQESLETADQNNDLVSRGKVETMLKKHSESQNEIARLRTELASYEQQKIINFTNPFTSVSYYDADCPQFEVSLETPRASNQLPTPNSRPSPRHRKLISPRSSKRSNSKEHIEVKKGHSIFNMFSKSNRTGRKDYIKYRDPHKNSSQSSVNSSEPISPGEKRKREQAELMIKSLRRKYGA